MDNLKLFLERDSTSKKFFGKKRIANFIKFIIKKVKIKILSKKIFLLSYYWIIKLKYFIYFNLF